MIKIRNVGELPVESREYRLEKVDYELSAQIVGVGSLSEAYGDYHKGELVRWIVGVIPIEDIPKLSEVLR